MSAGPNPCKQHGRRYCPSSRCEATARAAGIDSPSFSVNAEGNLALGIGSGLAVDLADGSIGIEVAPGFTVDLDPS